MAVLWSFFASQSPLVGGSGFAFQRPDPQAIEAGLLERINGERAERFLPPLQPSPQLMELARSHSRYMADIRELTHCSASGESFRDRLVKESGYFDKTGEGITFSETFRDDLIHGKLMDSPELRETILDPDFDRVGVGVAFREGRGYYVTLDFLQSLEIAPVDEVEQEIRDQINTIREHSRLPPLAFSREASEAAREFSMRKATGLTLPQIADAFGETLIHVITTPRPWKIDDFEEKVSGLVTEEAGVGVWFGKNPSYPGGIYVVTVFLFPKSRYQEALDEDLARMVFEEINERRRDRGLLALRWDRRLAREAEKMSDLLMSKETPKAAGSSLVRPKAFYNFILQNQTLTYVSEDPRRWPESVEGRILDARIRRIGIGISFRIDPESRRETFWISLITRD